MVKFHSTIACSKVEGNCLEGVGVFDGNLVEIDHSREPVYGDIVICHVDGKLLIKEYLGVFGGLHTVATHYIKPPNCMQQAFFVPKIDGVVTACYSKVWDIETRQRPEAPKPTGKGNVGVKVTTW